MIAHAYSNVQFDARLGQDSLRPGATLTLLASLSEYDVPLVREAAVWAEILDPALTPMSLRLARAADGTYSAEFKASLAGVYACRVRAEGYSSANQKFTREKRLTASTYYGDYTAPGSDRTEVCELLRCLVSDKAVGAHGLERLKEMGSNAYRTSHNPPTPELLDACDRLGMLVMDETRMMSSNPEGLAQFENLVRRDRNHPSVFMWSMGNEEGTANSKRGVGILTAMNASRLKT